MKLHNTNKKQKKKKKAGNTIFWLFFLLTKKYNDREEKNLRWAETGAKICVASHNLFWKPFFKVLFQSLTIYGMDYLENRPFGIVQLHVFKSIFAMKLEKATSNSFQNNYFL